MPFLTIHTNSDVKDSKLFLNEVATFVAGELHKPINYVIADLKVNKNMVFGGDETIKSALVELKSVGFGDKADLASKLTDFLADKLDASKSFINIHFVNMPASDLSIGGRMLG